ncbi:unnamed protein product, partial [Trichogramma brassicae]
SLCSLTPSEGIEGLHENVAAPRFRSEDLSLSPSRVTGYECDSVWQEVLAKRRYMKRVAVASRRGESAASHEGCPGVFEARIEFSNLIYAREFERVASEIQYELSALYTPAIRPFCLTPHICTRVQRTSFGPIVRTGMASAPPALVNCRPPSPIGLDTYIRSCFFLLRRSPAPIYFPTFTFSFTYSLGPPQRLTLSTSPAPVFLCLYSASYNVYDPMAHHNCLMNSNPPSLSIRYFTPVLSLASVPLLPAPRL